MKSQHSEKTKTEGRIQSECFAWYRKEINGLSGRSIKFLLYKIHNEGKKTKLQASIDAAMGIVSGYPDVCLPVPTLEYGALYVEFKKDENEKPTERQIFIHEELRKVGNKVAVVWTVEDFKKEVFIYLDIDSE